MLRSWILVVVTLAETLHATTVPPMSPAALQAAADVVVDGVVSGTECRQVGRRIITFATVVSTDAGHVRTTLVAIPGGVVGDIAQVVPGAPVLEPGVRYRLYLGRADGPRGDDDGPRARGIIGFWRGVFVLDGRGTATPLLPDGRAPTSPAPGLVVPVTP